MILNISKINCRFRPCFQTMLRSYDCFEYPKTLRELNNDYSLAPDKVKIKKEMLPNYQLIIADFYKTPISKVNKSLPKFFDKAKYVLNKVRTKNVKPKNNEYLNK